VTSRSCRNGSEVKTQTSGRASTASCSSTGRAAYVDSRAQRIYGGANEIMKELIARAL
jgi:alkylation response protein AidB-like acyl-CoA dehydrogenase